MALVCSTGYPDVDEMLRGLTGSKLYILAARPGVGKSAFALNVSSNVSFAANPVAFFSLEMDEQEQPCREEHNAKKNALAAAKRKKGLALSGQH